MGETETHTDDARLIGSWGSHSHRRPGTGNPAHKAAREHTGYKTKKPEKPVVSGG